MVDLLNRPTGRMGVSSEALQRMIEERQRNPAGWAGSMLGGPAVSEQMAGLDAAQRAALKRGGVRGLMEDPAVAEQAAGVASNFDFSGILAGKGAKGAPLGKMQQAEALEQAGASAEDIWKETGWFRSPDKDWRWEIDDSASRLKQDVRDTYIGQELRAPDVLEHPELYGAYPELAKLGVSPGSTGAGAAGNYSGTNIGLSPRLDARKQRSTMLHELQHGVQEREGFAEGGMGTDFDLYRRLAGEAESRAVEARRGLTPEQRRARFPLEDYDVPLEELIVRRR